MNTNNKKTVPTRFARATRFTVEPVEPALARELRTAESAELKKRLLGPWLAKADTETLRTLLQGVANEAEALAWTTGFPLLALPLLLEEKALAARAQAERAESVRLRSLPLVQEAA